jgi:hypothetical protein
MVAAGAAAATLAVTSTTGTAAETVIVGPGDGACGLAAAPEPDPCDAVQGLARYAYMQNLVNAAIFKTWKKQNPGEYQRLTAFMANPNCPTPANGAQPAMLTMFGATIVDVVQMFACARGVAPIEFGTVNPPSTGTDKTPPTPPSDLTVTETTQTIQ